MTKEKNKTEYQALIDFVSWSIVNAHGLDITHALNKYILKKGIK